MVSSPSFYRCVLTGEMTVKKPRKTILQLLLVCLLVQGVFVGRTLSAGALTGDTRLKVRVSALADNLVYKGASIREENFTVWGAGPVLDDEGKVHLYAARWPEKNVDPAWRKSSEIAHYEADSPEGPFTFVNVVVKSTGRTGQWDAFAPHNPEIKRFGDRYALVYIANTDFRQPPHPLNQSIGMMTATSPYGPWKKVGENGQILDDQRGHFSEGR